MNAKIKRNWTIIATLVTVAIFFLGRCTKQQNTICFDLSGAKEERETKVKRDTVYLKVKVPADNQVIQIKEVIVKDQEAQKLLAEKTAQLEKLTRQLLKYQKELSETGRITDQKEIHTLSDSVEVEGKAKVFFDISAEGKLYPPVFNFEFYQSDTTTTIRQVYEDKKNWQLGLSGGGALIGNDVRPSVGIDLNRKWIGVRGGYVFPMNAKHERIITGEVRLNLKF